MGNNNPNNLTTKQALEITALLIVLPIVLIILLFLGNTKSVETSKNTNKTIANATEDLNYYDLEVDIVDFTETYYNNQLAGNEKYLNKRIKITGELNNIEIDDSILLNLGTTCFLKSDKHYDVSCNFKNGDVTGLSSYNKKQNITIIGTVDTLRDGFPKKVIYLKKCIISK